ncbi:MAG: HD domain-containing protein, partial [Candidatus Omnitrophica bacterium]|nr:HD domain-containing protein [Candidatus Omnitrophota bacterium]
KYKLLTSSAHSIYRLFNSTYELKDLISRLARLLTQILNCSFCEIFLIDPVKTHSILKFTIIDKKRYACDKRTKVSGRIEKKIVNTSTSIRQDYLLAMPLICEDIMGAIILKRRKSEPPFDAFNAEMLTTLAEHSILGIRNLQLYEEQQKIVLGSIKSLVTLMDSRIPQEYTHSPYFSRVVELIAHEMKLDEKTIQSLKYASMLHDAGKIQIPLEILTKTTKLTPQEYKIIKMHPQKGAFILRHLQALKPAVPIIMHHHEKYDGTGYPSKLKKGQIPLGARVMSVADAFEAMVYGRPYRERMDTASAAREIKKKSGTQFDPRVVDAFLKIANKINSKKYLKPAKQ